MADNIRDRILAATLAEINLHGVDFHMDNLAKRLRISKRTLYEHFSSKQEIIEETMLSFAGKVYTYHCQVANDSTLSTEEKLKAYFAISNDNLDMLSVRKVNELIRKMPAICQRIREKTDEDWKILEQLLEEAQQSKEFKPFDTLLVLHVLRSAANDIVEYVSEADCDCSFSEYMTNCINILLYGIKNDQYR